MGDIAAGVERVGVEKLAGVTEEKIFHLKNS